MAEIGNDLINHFYAESKDQDDHDDDDDDDDDDESHSEDILGELATSATNSNNRANRTSNSMSNSSSNSFSSCCCLESFANFCASVLLNPAVVEVNRNAGDDPTRTTARTRCDQERTRQLRRKVRDSIKVVANAYINGEDTDRPIEILFDLLVLHRDEKYERSKNGDDSNSDSYVDSDSNCDSDDSLILSPQSAPASSTSTSVSTMLLPYKPTDLDAFHNDFEDCLEHTLLHKYLSKNWDKVDELIHVNERHNQKSKQKKKKMDITKNGISSGEQQEEEEEQRNTSSLIIKNNQKNIKKKKMANTNNDYYGKQQPQRHNNTIDAAEEMDESQHGFVLCTSSERTVFEQTRKAYYRRNAPYKMKKNQLSMMDVFGTTKTTVPLEESSTSDSTSDRTLASSGISSGRSGGCRDGGCGGGGGGNNSTAASSSSSTTNNNKNNTVKNNSDGGDDTIKGCANNDYHRNKEEAKAKAKTTMIKKEQVKESSSSSTGSSSSKGCGGCSGVNNNNLFFQGEKHRPTVYFLGGGMGAGKSSVVEYLKEKNDEMFRYNPVIVEADALKHADPIFQALLLYRQNITKYNQIMSNKKSSGDENDDNSNITNSSNSDSKMEDKKDNSNEEKKEECNSENSNNVKGNVVNNKQHRSNGNNDNVVSRWIHEHSTDAANRKLVVALANQRDVVVDGTMTWLPYVQQTIEMVRDAHKHRYLLGPGYKKETKKKNKTKSDDGTDKQEEEEEEVVTEQYWVRAESIDEDQLFLPYKVEMVGVTVDPEHAVSRGIRRAIVTGRGVPIKGQLRSHRLYSENFPIYASATTTTTTTTFSEKKITKRKKHLFDRIRLFDNSGSRTAAAVTDDDENDDTPTQNNETDAITTGREQQQQQQEHLQRRRRERPPPRCIAWKESPDQPLSFVPDAYEKFLKMQNVNDNATGVADLYNCSSSSSNNRKDSDSTRSDDEEKAEIHFESKTEGWRPSQDINNIVIQSRLRKVFSQVTER